MKLLVDALIGKFGRSRYSIDIRYGDADSKDSPVMPTNIQDTVLVELACKFTHAVYQKYGMLRETTFYYDSKSWGSHCNGQAFHEMDSNSSNSYMLSYLDDVSPLELPKILADIQSAVEDSDVHGKFVYSGITHDPNVKIG